MKHWIAYSDGGCRGNPGPAAIGLLVISPSGDRVEHGCQIGVATNQVAELTAARMALQRVPEGAEVVLVSDSQYVLKGISEWRRGWERRGWQNAAGDPVANLDHWHLLWAEVDLRIVRTSWVKGHSGVPENERCDRLAAEALDGASPEKDRAANRRVSAKQVKRAAQELLQAFRRHYGDEPGEDTPLLAEIEALAGAIGEA